jgi:hypothetical protein
VAADNANLIFIMGTNPRSVARQQYTFSTNARYEFHVSRATGALNAVGFTPQDDVILRFEFGAPTSNGRQSITLTLIRDGVTTKLDIPATAASGTTVLSDLAPITNTVSLGGGTNLSVFAGLREDPFFFDVEAFFRVRAGAVGTGPAAAFNTPANALDFTKGYNVNAIVVRVPIAWLAAGTGATVFDVWETISVRN